jgi:hypothetical protein
MHSTTCINQLAPSACAGVNQWDSDAPPKYVNNTHLSARVGRLNPDWNQDAGGEPCCRRLLLPGCCCCLAAAPAGVGGSTRIGTRMRVMSEWGRAMRCV